MKGLNKVDYDKMYSEICHVVKEFGIEVAYVFGSCSRGLLKENSDIDLAILGDIDFDIKMNISCKLEEKFGREIDLIVLSNVDVTFQAEIIYNGKIILNNNDELKSSTEMKIYSKYLTLQEDREPVIEAIYNRGSIY